MALQPCSGAEAGITKNAETPITDADTHHGNQPGSTAWSCSDSADLYRVSDWGSGLFEIGPGGTIRVITNPGSNLGVDLFEVVRGIQDRGIGLPVVIGFPELVEHRMASLTSAF